MTHHGFGSMRRKEDPRFLRGRGTYVDDIKPPGTLHGAVLHSPHAHARIVSIDTSAAEAHPKVKAVITGEMLATMNLAWMPTLSNDVQAVLATDKVRFQGQEVAFVVAEDRYSARDALELIDVDYEPLPVVSDARRAMDEDAQVIRDDVEGRTDNHIFDLVGTPRLIFLDEPTTGLDPRSRRTMWESIRALVADGVTIFLTRTLGRGRSGQGVAATARRGRSGCLLRARTP